jgi:hypothetical protein
MSVCSKSSLISTVRSGMVLQQQGHDQFWIRVPGLRTTCEFDYGSLPRAPSMRRPAFVAAQKQPGQPPTHTALQKSIRTKLHTLIPHKFQAHTRGEHRRSRIPFFCGSLGFGAQHINIPIWTQCTIRTGTLSQGRRKAAATRTRSIISPVTHRPPLRTPQPARRRGCSWRSSTSLACRRTRCC